MKRIAATLRTLSVSVITGLLMVSLSGLTGCVTEPVTGRQRLILTSMDAEMNMSAQTWQEMLQEKKLSNNTDHIAAVRRVGSTISEAVNKPEFEWEFRVFDSEEANAFCLPGGKVGVYEGLFKYVSNDAELAAVVGHEIAHATARHGGERMTQALALSLGGAALAYALKDQPSEDQQRWLLAYGGLSTIGVVLPYSRVHENAADEIGLIYMARAGYDPHAAVSFWQKFSEGKGQQPALSEFLSTHPLDKKRIEHLNELMPRAMQEYRDAPRRYGLGESY
jgi:predicted Zn-dependent protease